MRGNQFSTRNARIGAIVLVVVIVGGALLLNSEALRNSLGGLAAATLKPLLITEKPSVAPAQITRVVSPIPPTAVAVLKTNLPTNIPTVAPPLKPTRALTLPRPPTEIKPTINALTDSTVDPTITPQASFIPVKQPTLGVVIVTDPADARTVTTTPGRTPPERPNPILKTLTPTALPTIHVINTTPRPTRTLGDSSSPTQPPAPQQQPPPTNPPCGTAVPGRSGFPIVGMSGCLSAPVIRHSPSGWNPIAVGKATCANWFVYHTNQGGGWEIYRLGDIPGKPKANPDLSQTAGQGVDNIGPSMSPDRRWITFASQRGGSWEIYIAPTDASGPVRRATFNPLAPSVAPVWSPDGKMIVFESVSNGSWNLFLFNVQSGQETQLTIDSANDIEPYWSPDSKSIVFTSTREGGLWQIERVDIVGQKVTRLSDGTGDDFDPVFAPDGIHILYQSVQNAQSSINVLYTMNSDGSGKQPISDPNSSAGDQSFSPDGSLIAYDVRNVPEGDGASSKSGIYVYQPATGSTRLVTDLSGNSSSYAPTWRCTGATLIFTSDASGTPNLYSVDALPMDAAMVRIGTSTSAIQLTALTTAAAQFAEDSPAQAETASRHYLLPTPTK